MSKLLRHVSAIKRKSSNLLGCFTKLRLPVKCSVYHLLHLRDCLINKDAQRPQVHLNGKKGGTSKKGDWYVPWSWELTYQARGMSLPHTSEEQRPNQFSFRRTKKGISNYLMGYLFITLLKIMSTQFKLQPRYSDDRKHTNDAFRDCT